MAKRIIPIIIAIPILLICLQCHAAGTVQLSEAKVDSMLISLRPLPKIHYFWRVSPEVEGRKLYELARITHSLCLSGKWVTKQQVDKCVYICERVNKTTPKIKTFLGIEFSPFTHEFGKDLPPTDRGASYLKDIDQLKNRAELAIRWIAAANKKYKSNIKVGAILLDCERFHVRADDKKWNEGIHEALDTVHLMLQSIFPGARMEWYGRGVAVSAGGDGWAKRKYWTGKEIKAPLSCSLYTVPEIERTRETFRRTAKLADELGISDVTPWVALASGYRRHKDEFQKFSLDWDYDIIYSYLLGAELNIEWYGDRPKRFAPYNRAKVVIFYPPPFDKRTTHWVKHFIAYVRGATRDKELKDLGFEE